MSEILSLEEARDARARRRAQELANAMLMTDHDRISMNSESIRLAYEAILEILDRLDTLEGPREQAPQNQMRR